MKLTFDPSFTGESGGAPHNVAAPDINTEDFSAVVGFLGLSPLVDGNRIRGLRMTSPPNASRDFTARSALLPEDLASSTA